MKFDDMQIDQQGSSDQESIQNEHENNQKMAPDTNQTSEKCLAELSMWQDQCKRISAEFENFKKRIDRDKARWAEIAQESLLKELVGFIDTFELALQQKEGVDHQGIQMVHQELIKLLHKFDVVAMPITIEFDPQFHEAIMQVDSTDRQSGQIVQFLSKGFMIKDRVLRPAKVSLAA